MLINFLLSTMLKIFCNKALEPNSTEKKKKKTKTEARNCKSDHNFLETP